MEITLALGGGGARGMAHIGVLRVLENAGFKVQALAGTSIGAIVAAFYALGKSADEIEKIFSGVDQSRLFGWPLSGGPGLLGTRGVADFLRIHFGEKAFYELQLPCAAIAVDLNSNREIILQDGNIIVEALLGSSAVPGLFPPREYNQYRLVDGGVLDPIPVRAARALRPNLPVVAVSLMSPLQTPSTPLALPGPRQIAETITRLHITQAIRVFVDATDVGQRQLADLRLKLDKPEALVWPDVTDINLLDTVNIPDLARRGELATLKKLPELQKMTSWPARLRRTLKLS